MNNNIPFVAVVFLFVVTPFHLFAATLIKSTAEGEFTPGTLNQGFETHVTAFNPTTNDNYATGFEEANSFGEFRGYFIFDLSGVSGVVTSATLEVELGNYTIEFEPEATVGFFDVSADPSTLRQNGLLAPNAPSFNDLGTGNMYGSFAVNMSDALPPSTIINVSLDAAAISDINLHLGQYFAIGATLTSPPLGQNTVLLFGSTQGQETHLVLNVVPEPSTLALLTLGAVGLLAVRRR